MSSQAKPGRESLPAKGKSGSAGLPAKGKPGREKLSPDRAGASAGREGAFGGRSGLVAMSAMFAALALIFSYVEMLIPLPIPIPGIKLGIANLVIIIAMYRMGFKYAFVINFARIILAGLLFSGVFGIIYSMAGGILSLLVMYGLYRTGLFGMVGISMAGGVCHNLGQLVTACVLLQNTAIMSYFAVLLFSGIISGIGIGVLAYTIERRLPVLGTGRRG